MLAAFHAEVRHGSLKLRLKVTVSLNVFVPSTILVVTLIDFEPAYKVLEVENEN